jgi:predicted nucleotidyltransferase
MGNLCNIDRKDIRELARCIAREFQPERIILFGSHARGAAAAHSDVDLLVVMDCAGKCWRMATRIRSQVRPWFPVDLLVRSSRELEGRIEQGDPFLREIVEQGEVLYERPHP